MFLKNVVVLVSLLGSTSSFLLNSSSYAGGNAYQNLISLFVDEKNARHQLEDRLDKLEAFDNEVANELHKDRNNRQQLMDQNTKLSTELEKAKSSLLAMKQQYDILERNFTNQTNILHSILAELANNTDVHNANVSISQETLFEKMHNLSIGQTENYHTLLQQYQTVNSQSRDRYVELNGNLRGMNKTIQNVTLQTALNHQKIMEQGVQLGFSLKNVNKSSGSDQLKFTLAVLNTGNMVNMSTGEFVCKRAGLYFFTATIVREPGIVESYCFIIVRTPANDWLTDQGTVGQASTTSGYASGTTALLYHLNVGDKVFLGACHGIDHMYRESSFSGFLIVQD